MSSSTKKFKVGDVVLVLPFRRKYIGKIISKEKVTYRVHFVTDAPIVGGKATLNFYSEQIKKVNVSENDVDFLNI